MTRERAMVLAEVREIVEAKMKELMDPTSRARRYAVAVLGELAEQISELEEATANARIGSYASAQLEAEEEIA